MPLFEPSCGLHRFLGCRLDPYASIWKARVRPRGGQLALFRNCADLPRQSCGGTHHLRRSRGNIFKLRLGSRNADRRHHFSGAIANRGSYAAHAYLFFFIVDGVAQSLHIFAGKPKRATRGYRVLVVPHEPLLADQFIEHV
jgi:hypothetical protein